MKTRKTLNLVLDKQALRRKFLTKVVQQENGCHNWVGSINFYGYGQFAFEGRSWSAHRLAYELANGAIPQDTTKWWVLHTCDNPACCNPLHLYLGDAKDNSRDMIDRKRQRMGFKRYGEGESIRFGRVFYEICGEIKTIFEWAEFFNVNPSTLEQRIAAGWPEKDLGISSKAYKRHLKSEGKTKYKRFSGLKQVEDYKNETPAAVTTEASESTNRDGNIDMTTVSKRALVNTQSAANSTFSFEEHQIRTVMRNGEPWFVASDTCKALDLSNPSKSVASLDDDEKQLFNGDSNFKLGSAGNGAQSVIIINESGLYTLILRCRDAVKQGTLPWRFRKWVTNEVLPSIRKTGSYQVPADRKDIPIFRYIITLHYQDVVTGEEETLKGGCNTPEEIVRGTAKKFGIFIPEMVAMPMTAYY